MRRSSLDRCFSYLSWGQGNRQLVYWAQAGVLSSLELHSAHAVSELDLRSEGF